MSDNQPTTPTDDQRPTNDQPVYESVKDAARRLGLSENAVRLRIKRGTLAADKIGDNWFVVVGDQPPTTSTTTGPTTSDQSRLTTSERLVDDQAVVVAAVEQATAALTDRYAGDMRAMFERLEQLYQERLADKDQMIGVLRAGLEQAGLRMAELAKERDKTRIEAEIAALEREQIAAERDALQGRVREFEQRQVESSVEGPRTPPEPPQRVQKPRQRRWWLRLFGVDE